MRNRDRCFQQLVLAHSTVKQLSLDELLRFAPEFASQ